MIGAILKPTSLIKGMYHKIGSIYYKRSHSSPQSLLTSIKGFSLIEILISLAAFGLFAILVQSVLVIGHSFQVSQSNFMDTIQMTRMLKQTVCLANSAFRAKSFNSNKMYLLKTKEVGDITKGGYIQRKYEKMSFFANQKQLPFLKINITGIKSETATSKISARVSRIIANAKSPQAVIELSGGQPTAYKIFQDSHTFVKLNMHASSLSANMTGYIFASRCVENNKTQAIEDKNNKGVYFTFDNQALKSSAVYLLESKYRPYYFPTTNRQFKNTIQCCEDGAVNCGSSQVNSGKWVPRIYIIYLKDITLGTGVIAGIQEEPSLQDINSVWGSGFILTTNFSSSNSLSFTLDMIFLRNRCDTSPMHIARCPYLVYGQNPNLQYLVSTGGTKTFPMSDFIYPDVVGCSGYSRGLGATSYLQF